MKIYRTAVCLALIVFVCHISGSAQQATAGAASEVRKVDFKNFNYGAVCAGYHKFLPTDPDQRLVLHNGHVSFDELNYADLGSVKYVDFDGDGEEEAFVLINGQTSGSSN